MITPRLLGLAFAAAALGQVASAQSLYLLEKEQLYLQTSAAAPAAFPGYPYEASIQAAAATNLVSSAGTTAIPAVGPNGDPGLNLSFATQAALDAAFPNGSFVFSGPPSYTIPLTGDLYPTAVPAVLSGGTWTNGVLVVDPAVSTTLQFSTFSTYATVGQFGHMQFQAESQTTSQSSIGTSIATQGLFGLTPSATPLTSYAIPAGTLIAGGVYQCALNFDTGAYLNTTSVPNGGLIGLYSKTLVFYMVAKPATTATTLAVSPLANVNGGIGGTVTIPVTGNGLSNGLNQTVTWFFNGNPVSITNGGRYSYQNASLVISKATAADAGKYYAIIAGAGGLAVTNEITLTMVTSTTPQITTQPVSATVNGGTVVFNVIATGGGLTYQWRLNGTNLAPATSSRLIITNAGSNNVGTYTCLVSNPAGSVLSNPAQLTLLGQSANVNGRLVNESVSAVVPTGQTLTVGFAIGGGSGAAGQTDPLLIRGIGPSLATFGLTGTMPDPAISVIPLGSSTALFSNDNWGSNQAAVAAADTATQAFPLTVGSLDAALTASLAAGGYSVALTGNTTGGTALAEIYDNVGTYVATAPRIVNLSALTNVSAGGSLTAGFILAGSTARTVLVRAMGPALAALGLNGTMTDPKLTLQQTSNGTVVGANQGWGGDSQLAGIANQVGGFAFAGINSLDSAILVTLFPGVGYSAQASSASGGSGQVLIEVYEVP